MTGSDPARPVPAPVTHPAPWNYAAPWGARGYVTDLDGPVHWIEFSPGTSEQAPGQGENEPPIVFVHGLGGSHLNWCLIGPQLAAGRRAVALDLRGFGLTPGLRANSTVQANARLLDRFITEVIGAPVILVGNSMGGLISILETTANPDAIRGVALVDPALPLPPQKPDWPVTRPVPALRPARPRPAGRSEAAGEHLTGASRPAAHRALLRRPVTSRPRDDQGRSRAGRPAPPGHGRPGVGPRPDLPRRRPLAARVLARRWKYNAMMAGIDVPVLLIGGEADRLVPVAAMRQAAARNPQWESVFLPGVGHAPQLEVPGADRRRDRRLAGRHFASPRREEPTCSN